MSYEHEVAKEFLRDSFHKGTLDVTDSFESIRNFVRIFEGEMEAIIAITHANFLDESEREELLKLAKPTKVTARQYKTWHDRAVGTA